MGDKKPRQRRTIAEQRQEHVDRIARCEAALEAAKAGKAQWEHDLREKHAAALRELGDES